MGWTLPNHGGVFGAQVTKNPVSTSQGFKSLVLKNGHNSEFFYYALKHKTPEIEASASGSTFKEISGGALSSITVDVPEPEKQAEIVAPLLALDNKVACNNKVLITLNETLRVIYKSWFVDFDVVIDNALEAGNSIPDQFQKRALSRQRYRQLNQQITPRSIRENFPDKFVLSKSGEWLPEGWEFKLAKDISSIGIGKTPPRKEEHWFDVYGESNYVWVSIKDMGKGGMFLRSSKEYLVEEAINRFNVRVIPRDSVLLSFKLTVGRTAIAGTELTTNEAIAHFHDFKDSISEKYFLMYLRTFDFSSLGSTSSIATAVNSRTIKNMDVLVPNKGALAKFDEITTPIFKLISSVEQQSQKEEMIRDMLLPRVITNQV